MRSENLTKLIDVIQKISDIEPDIDKILAIMESMEAITSNRILSAIKELEAIHPYAIKGRPETYNDYNQGWEDALDRLSTELNLPIE